MSNRIGRQLIGGGLIMLAAVLLSGCESCKPGKPGPMGKYTVEVALDESLKTSSVIVDLVGVNALSLSRWEAYDMGRYWREGDAMRRDADKVVLNFVSGQTLSKTLPSTDPQWEKWKSKGVTHVLVLADLPGAQTSRPGNQDARRQIVPLDTCSWPKKTTNLKVLVQRSGIVVVTAPRTPK